MELESKQSIPTIDIAIATDLPVGARFLYIKIRGASILMLRSFNCVHLKWTPSPEIDCYVMLHIYIYTYTSCLMTFIAEKTLNLSILAQPGLMYFLVFFCFTILLISLLFSLILFIYRRFLSRPCTTAPTSSSHFNNRYY